MTAINGKRAWDGLCALLVDLGQPPEVPRPSTTHSALHLPYIHLMEECAGRDISRVRHLFVEVDVPTVRRLLVDSSHGSDDGLQNQPALFLFNLSQLDVEDFEIKDLLYHIFTVCFQAKGSPPTLL